MFGVSTPKVFNFFFSDAVVQVAVEGASVMLVTLATERTVQVICYSVNPTASSAIRPSISCILIFEL